MTEYEFNNFKLWVVENINDPTLTISTTEGYGFSAPSLYDHEVSELKALLNKWLADRQYKVCPETIGNIKIPAKFKKKAALLMREILDDI